MNRTSTRLVAAGAVAGLLVLSACGSDANDESSSTEAPAATEAVTETTEAMTETTEAMTEGTEAMAEEANIVETAVAAGSFEHARRGSDGRRSRRRAVGRRPAHGPRPDR